MTAVKTPPKPVAARLQEGPANSNKKHEFKTNDHVVYPTMAWARSPASRRRKSPA
jgi:hypothetical protein